MAGQVLLPSPDSGFITGINTPAIQIPEVKEPKELNMSASCLLYYDSNLGLSPGTEEFPTQGGIVAICSPAIIWHRSASGVTVGLSAQGGLNQYFDHSEFNGGNYRIGGDVEYDGGRWDLKANFQQGFTEGVNRFYGDAMAQYLYGSGASLEYRISPKTELDAAWSSSWVEPDGGYSSTESHSLELSAIWRYSPLLRFGPGIRMRSDSGEMVEDRGTLGPVMSVQYALSRKLALTGRIGFDFVKYSSGSRDHFVSGEMGLSYSPSRPWSVTFSVFRDVVADGAVGGGFREATAVKLGVNREIRNAMVGVNLSYEHDRFSGGSGDSSRAPVDFVLAGLNLDVPVFHDHAKFSTFFRFQQSVSDDLTRDWDGIQTGCGLTFDF